MKSRQPGKVSHAKTRFKQRYGRDISTEQLNALVDLAEANKVISKLSDRGNLRVKLRIGQEVIHFVYSQATLQIITFFPA
tara:strand:+ start:6427 stop:6666 length:240 start_codon:yes stop_codon:yes gene_type:complete